MHTRSALIATAALFALSPTVGSATAATGCLAAGPQTPRDISSIAGTNKVTFPIAPSATKLNLCNIHFHKHAEHKGPGFSVFKGRSKFGGYACNATAKLTKAELAPASAKGCAGIQPGDTIEVHWVHSSCDSRPGPGLGSCVPKGCVKPALRVEAQVFVVVNDRKAADFAQYAHKGHRVNDLFQAKSLPTGTGKPVTFRGSTTGPKYTSRKCSPFKVTWNVRSMCAKIDIDTLHAWCRNNVFNETGAHGVRQLVTAPSLLAPIE